MYGYFINKTYLLYYKHFTVDKLKKYVDFDDKN
jgi:hypothetical protein